MEKPKTVLLWGREDLLSQSMAFFLTNEKEWEVIQISDNQNMHVLINEVEKVKPDVVILYQGDCASFTHLPGLLLHGRPKLKVITVSLENNSMEVYNKKKVWLKSATDLLSVVDD